MDYGKLLQPLLETVVIVIVPVLAAYIAALLRKQIAAINAQIPADQMAFVAGLAEQFVIAAEQTGLASGVKVVGAAKKAEVLAALQAVVDARKIPVSVAELEALIEGAVVSQFGYHGSEYHNSATEPAPDAAVPA